MVSSNYSNSIKAQVAEDGEYADYALAKELDPTQHMSLGYDTKHSDSEAPVLEL